MGNIISWVIAGILVLAVGGFCTAALGLSYWDSYQKRRKRNLGARKEA